MAKAPLKGKKAGQKVRSGFQNTAHQTPASTFNYIFLMCKGLFGWGDKVEKMGKTVHSQNYSVGSLLA